jgi:hypothetical protein
MKIWIITAAATLLAACGNNNTVAANAVVPDLNTTSEAPGDWSALSHAVGQTPAASGLLQQSPITVDLNALLGPNAEAFRLALGDATPLRREGELLVTMAQTGRAYLVLHPAEHAIAAGFRQGTGWRSYRTPGTNVALPAEIRGILAVT